MLRGGPRFRTNIGLVNMADQVCSVRVRIFEPSGVVVSDPGLVAMRPTEWRQLNNAVRTGVDAAYATIEPLMGCPIWAYASVVDNLSNDPTTVLMREWDRDCTSAAVLAAPATYAPRSKAVYMMAENYLYNRTNALVKNMVDAGLFGEIGNGMEGAGHLLVEAGEDLFPGPEEVGVALDLLEIRAGDPTRVGEEVRNHEDAALFENLVGLGSRRAIGSLGDDPDVFVDPLDVVGGDLVLEGRRDQDVFCRDDHADADVLSQVDVRHDRNPGYGFKRPGIQR